MTLRADYFQLAPKAFDILLQQEVYLRQQFSQSPTLSSAVWELIKLRVSQLNQCAFCIDMHSKQALKAGETAERIIGLSAWEDMPLYSATERAALAWTDQISLVGAPDDSFYSKIEAILGASALVDLTVAINAIHSWNRIAKTFKPEMGSYQAS